MNYGIVAAGRFGDDIEDAFRMASKIGFDGLEIPFNRLECEEELIWTPEGVGRLRRLSERYGLAMPSLIGGRYNRRGFTDDDPEVRGEAAEVMLHLIDMCAEAGIERILTAFFGDQMIEDETDVQRAIDGVAACAPKAESRGVTLALEGTVDAGQWLRIIDAVASDAVGVYYDVGNAVWIGLDTPVELEMLSDAGVLEQIHIKDMTEDKVNSPLGEGDVDWDEVAGAIEEIGYDQWLVLETPRSDTPEEDYARYLELVHSRIEAAPGGERPQ